MPINSFRATFAAVAALCLLAGCEAARVTQPQAAPSPADNVAASASALGLAPSAVAEPAAVLAQHVQGWEQPSAPAPMQSNAKLDPAMAAELAERGARMERELRAAIAEGRVPR